MSRDVLHSSSGPFLAQTIATRSAHPQLASKQGTPTQPRPADLGALHDDVPLPIVSQELPPSQGFRTTAPPSASKHFAASALAICPLGSRRLHHGSTRSNPVHSLGGRPQTRARAGTLSKQRNQSSRPSPAARAAAHASKSTSVASASAPPACKFPHLTNNELSIPEAWAHAACSCQAHLLRRGNAADHHERRIISCVGGCDPMSPKQKENTTPERHVECRWNFWMRTLGFLQFNHQGLDWGSSVP